MSQNRRAGTRVLSRVWRQSSGLQGIPTGMPFRALRRMVLTRFYLPGFRGRRLGFGAFGVSPFP